MGGRIGRPYPHFLVDALQCLQLVVKFSISYLDPSLAFVGTARCLFGASCSVFLAVAVSVFRSRSAKSRLEVFQGLGVGILHGRNCWMVRFSIKQVSHSAI